MRSAPRAARSASGFTWGTVGRIGVRLLMAGTAFPDGQGSQFFVQPPRDGQQLAKLAGGEVSMRPPGGKLLVQVGCGGTGQGSSRSQCGILINSRWVLSH